ncbi:putative methyltransferase [Corynebacterium urogenitale]|uniref:Putative methyltransferase n=1 Tax=Corynebacterium urogenitale TaxID=2487892 RepID=A0A5J6Z3J2_9CORY|nr:class I SAM-dependent methyltransferase [Corynebacterium urogenitale]QFQ01628.1 putative methyltransferase [Corynebacterium urogenitale]
MLKSLQSVASKATARATRVPDTLRVWKHRATLRRSFGLLNSFKYEQTDPGRFYGLLARDTVELIESIWQGAGQDSLQGKRILDVGGGPGYFGIAFDEAGANYITCEPDVGEMSAAGIELQSSVRGSGLDLPFRDDVFDITYSSNVAEHVPEPWRMADEMLRVTTPGGVMIYSYTCWLGPFGGHETGLWQHYVGGEFAARRYKKKRGKEPKNRWGESLFDVGCGEGMDYAQRVTGESESRAELLAAFPRYHPWWAWWMVHVPGLREFAVSNLVLVFRRL